MTDLDSTP